jgi:predicted nucleic acid-binding protein
MSGVIVDSSVFIASWRGEDASHAFLRSVATDIRLHPIVEAELLCGARNRAEMLRLTSLLNMFPRVAVKNADFPASIELLRTHHLVSTIGWADCLIAATCIRLDLRLATLNAKHFRAIRRLRTQTPS